jgi:hypothetical protein
MMDDRHATEKREHEEKGNLGQKQAEREEAADEKLEHMGEKTKPSSGKPSQKQQKK